MRITAALWVLAGTIFLAMGFVGAFAYVDGYWLYRGFPPPHIPAQVAVAGHPRRHVRVQPGTLQTIAVTSPALGGRTEPVLVLLPPGYFSNPTQRYPVMYLLHGTPGGPQAFLQVARVAVVEAESVARGTMRPMIIVMPMGGPTFFSDTQWVNGVGGGSGWETYMARDVVHAIDRRYRTIPTGKARGIGGYSEGGYGAINIALHHPGEFGFVESWSGYEEAFAIPGIYGSSQVRMAYDSPITYLTHVAARLRRRHTFFWIYTGAQDNLRPGNQQFADELTRYRLAHRFFVVAGEHNWSTWRVHVPQALIAASRHLSS